jgi:hypothetical protein
MKIGIDVSQIAYQDTGVANYISHLIEEMIRLDKTCEFVLFFSSLRRRAVIDQFASKISSHNVVIKDYSFPPAFLDLLWNKLHIVPIENFIGDVDIFISSDWTQPPTKKAKSATILYDLIVYKFPEEMDQKIIKTQKRKLHWVKKECELILCISQATKNDAIDILKISADKLQVVYPGMTL